MQSRKTSIRKPLFWSLVILLLLANITPAAAQVEQANPALFYEELAPHGNWVNYENHGAVWQPKGVGQNWRPYQNGRWVPSEQGYIFETKEPWGWATYHYGNWMPTQQHGWVWKPGRTWYPHTCAWKSNEEYVGWAPVPPEGYEPAAGLESAGDMGAGEGMGAAETMGSGGGGGILDLLTAPFWIVTKAASFLLGLGQDYAPNYSYVNSGALLPYSYVPVVIGNMGYVDNYVSPSYAPQACYNWGPPISYVTQVTQINSQTINNYIKTANINRIANGAPSLAALQRRPYLRENWEGVSRGLQDHSIRVNRVRDIKMAQRHLYNPNAQPLPRHLPPLPSELSRGRQNPSLMKASSGENSGQNWQWSRGRGEEGRQPKGKMELSNPQATNMTQEQKPQAGGRSGNSSLPVRPASWEPRRPAGLEQPRPASITPQTTPESTTKGGPNPGQKHPWQQPQVTRTPQDDRQKTPQPLQAPVGQPQVQQQVQARQHQAQQEQQRQQENQRQHRRQQEVQQQQQHQAQQEQHRRQENQRQQMMQQRQVASQQQQQRQQQMAQQQQQQQAQQERQRQMESQRQQMMQQRQVALQQQQQRQQQMAQQQQQRQQQMVQQMQQRQQQMAQQRQQCPPPRPQQVVQQRPAPAQPPARPQPQQQQQKKKHQQ